ncbi:hypothetical protein OEJ37_11515 [Burkholderia sp. BKH01]|uniref:hypothetical protein n=1 Tax=Burkholderia sp. BKH01 TaxID=2769262 RepID=UPI0021DF6EDF|nr:hypothetical protein [Burkholderia sp. BKH01]MCU9953985.1 hypothetical protein [Burkholderia sp. BKH01]
MSADSRSLLPRTYLLNYEAILVSILNNISQPISQQFRILHLAQGLTGNLHFIAAVDPIAERLVGVNRRQGGKGKWIDIRAFNAVDAEPNRAASQRKSE